MPRDFFSTLAFFISTGWYFLVGVVSIIWGLSIFPKVLGYIEAHHLLMESYVYYGFFANLGFITFYNFAGVVAFLIIAATSYYFFLNGLYELSNAFKVAFEGLNPSEQALDNTDNSREEAPHQPQPEGHE